MAPAPPVGNPEILLLPSTTLEGESPGSEKGPDFEVRGVTATSFDIVLGSPSK